MRVFIHVLVCCYVIRKYLVCMQKSRQNRIKSQNKQMNKRKFLLTTFSTQIWDRIYQPFLVKLFQISSEFSKIGQKCVDFC